ncbi:DUF2637 domain-containing protein [Kitasatospora misakiensis]|uniref:DUF2637 domain-containing protein n=1 Tax=Kitasatospora misakiensis TaxID=67330 RepID=A0ABW0XDU9_9ACTN
MARPSLTKAHRGLLGLVAAGASIISGIGFAGSYNAVRELAEKKGFGAFSYAFPIGVDAGIVVLLALDLVLTWLRIPFPLLRQTAWLLTVATIAFNAAASWGDPLGMGMHAVIPLLFVVVVEASRHAVGRIAAITADRHMDSVRMMRWLLSPVPTFRLWRRMKLWELRSYDEVVRLEQNRLVYRAQLRFRYGRGWRRSAPIQALLPLKLAKYGVPLDPTVFDRMDEDARVAREEKEAREVEAAARAEAALAAQEARALQESRAAAALVPAGQAARAGNGGSADPAGAPDRARGGAEGSVKPGPQQPPVREDRQAGPAGAQLPGQAQGRPQPQAKVQAQAQARPEQQSQAEPAPAEVLARLAAVRLRDAQEPAGGEQQAPAEPQEELNVWTARAVRTTGHPSDGAPGGRVPAQVSPWFKPPRPTESELDGEPEQEAGYAGEADLPAEPEFAQSAVAQSAVAQSSVAQAPFAEERFADQGHADQGHAEPEAVEEASEFAERPQRPAGPAPRPGAYRLDPEQAFEALVSYIDTFEHEPDPQRLAAWLTKKYGVTGSRPDGSVHPKDVEALYPELRDRYATSGRD